MQGWRDKDNEMEGWSERQQARGSSQETKRRNEERESGMTGDLRDDS